MSETWFRIVIFFFFQFHAGGRAFCWEDQSPTCSCWHPNSHEWERARWGGDSHLQDAEPKVNHHGTALWTVWPSFPWGRPVLWMFISVSQKNIVSLYFIHSTDINLEQMGTLSFHFLFSLYISGLTGLWQTHFGSLLLLKHQNVSGWCLTVPSIRCGLRAWTLCWMTTKRYMRHS